MTVTVRSDHGERADLTGAQLIPLSEPSERAQAQLFVAILRREVKAMAKIAAKAEAECQRRCEMGDDVDPPERLIAVRTRIEEVEQMIKALDARFLR